MSRVQGVQDRLVHSKSKGDNAPSDQQLEALTAAERHQLFGYPWLLGSLVFAISCFAPMAEVRWEGALVGLLLILSPLAYLAGWPVKWVIQCTTAICALGVGIVTLQTGGIYSPQIAWLLLLPVMPLRLVSVRVGLAWMLLCMAYVCVLGSLVEHHALTWLTTQPSADVWTWTMLQKLLLGLCLLALPWYYVKTYQQSMAVMRYQSKIIHQKKKELVHEQANKKIFISKLSHEMRTPMNAVMGFAHLLAMEAEKHPQVGAVVEHVQTTAKHLMAIINGIMDYTQLIDGQLLIKSEVVNVQELVQDVFNMFSQRLRSMQVAYTCDLTSSAPRWLNSDGMRLTQILINFIEHALQRTAEGYLQLKVEQTHEAVLFTVHDAGSHINPEEIRLLNATWQHVKDMPMNHVNGAGLGVCMAKALAHLMGGDVNAVNHPGKGASLCLRLPLALVIDRQVQADMKAASRGWFMHEVEMEVLVVDDNPVNRLLVCQVIKAHWAKARVVQADNGIKALECLHQGAFDLVLMDMLMPEMDGIEATRHLRQSKLSPNQWIPVLGLTANISTDDHVRCLSAGMNDILLKPFDRHHLVQRIEKMLLDSPMFTTKHAVASGPQRPMGIHQAGSIRG